MRTQERMSLCINACSASLVRVPPACLRSLRGLRGLRVNVSRCVGVQDYAAMDGCILERLHVGMYACKNAVIQRGVPSRMRADMQTYVCILTMRLHVGILSRMGACLCVLAMCSACAWRLSERDTRICRQVDTRTSRHADTQTHRR